MFQLILEDDYKYVMKNEVEPYLAAHGGDHQTEREAGKQIHYVKYLAEQPVGVMMVSHGFTESTEKYKEICYYFLKEGYHVYMPDHCGHGKSYRLTENDHSLVHIDTFQRYIDDFLHLTEIAKEEQPGLPVYLFGHSMGGGIAAACAAQMPERFMKVILSSPMIRPLTYGVPYRVSKRIAEGAVRRNRGGKYVIGTRPYEKPDQFDTSASLSKARFSYYEKKRYKEPLYQTSAPSYGWANGAVRLNHYLQTEAYRKIAAPVLLLQAGRDTYVDNNEQNLFVKKINEVGKTTAKQIRYETSKHELFNAEDPTAQEYWETIFRFLNREDPS